MNVDKILIKDLRTRCIIGVFDHERTHPQDVVINITLCADTRPAAASDDIADAIDYKSIKDEVIGLVEDSEYRLVETLAQAIADCCLQDKRVQEVTVRLDKPTALSFADSVAIEICRKQGNN